MFLSSIVVVKPAFVLVQYFSLRAAVRAQRSALAKS
jgi:hypothetical protein